MSTSVPGLKETVEAFLRHTQPKVTAHTHLLYSRYLGLFEAEFGGRPLEAVKAFQVEEWLASKPGQWGETTQHYIGSILTAFARWAARTERVTKNPLADLSRPPAGSRGEKAVIPREAHLAVLGAARPPLAQVLMALWDTGARPGEVFRVTAADFSADRGTWTLWEHKTSRKKRKARVIWLTPKLVDLCRILAEEQPAGPMFRNQLGRPWTRDAVSQAVKRICLKLRIPVYIPYGYRHTFATEALARGVPEAQVAELLGHSGTQMLHRHYSHLLARQDVLREALARVRTD